VAKKRVRIGARDTFLKKAEGVLFTGRKSFSTKATFTGVLTLGVISSLGAITSIFTPTAVGQQPGMDQYLTGGFATIAAYGMYKAADNMANQWWVQEK
jgi:hypothetical protein